MLYKLLDKYFKACYFHRIHAVYRVYTHKEYPFIHFLLTQKYMPDSIEKLEQYLQTHSPVEEGNLRLREVAYKRLYDALRNIELEPGEPLPEVRLSKVLGISRTPLREALQQLASDGLIQIIQGRAVTTSARSAQEVFDALHVRELLEPQSIKLCVGVISREDIEHVQRLTDKMDEAARAGDRAGWSRADREWHEVLCGVCPNKLLGQLVLLARTRMYHRGSDEYVPLQYLIDGTAEHRRIVDAIVAQEAEKAEQLMFDHLQTLRENIFKRLIRHQS